MYIYSLLFVSVKLHQFYCELISLILYYFRASDANVPEFPAKLEWLNSAPLLFSRVDFNLVDLVFVGCAPELG